MGFANVFSGGAVSLPDGPLNYGFGSPELGDGRTNMLAGMGITDEYNRMLMDILGGDGSTFESTKRQRDADGEDGDERQWKRSRIEVVS
jgi:hypothetical protein